MLSLFLVTTNTFEGVFGGVQTNEDAFTGGPRTEAAEMGDELVLWNDPNGDPHFPVDKAVLAF